MDVIAHLDHHLAVGFGQRRGHGPQLASGVGLQPGAGQDARPLGDVDDRGWQQGVGHEDVLHQHRAVGHAHLHDAPGDGFGIVAGVFAVRQMADDGRGAVVVFVDLALQQLFDLGKGQGGVGGGPRLHFGDADVGHLVDRFDAVERDKELVVIGVDGDVVAGLDIAAAGRQVDHAPEDALQGVDDHVNARFIAQRLSHRRADVDEKYGQRRRPAGRLQFVAHTKPPVSVLSLPVFWHRSDTTPLHNSYCTMAIAPRSSPGLIHLSDGLIPMEERFCCG